MVFNKNVRLASWYQAALICVTSAALMGTILGLASGKLGGAAIGILIGLIMGLGRHFRQQRLESDHQRVDDDYPEDLKRVQQRYDRRWIALALTLMLFGIAVSWIVVGVGWYGLLSALPAIVLASWVLGRFGGPSDPKWKRVRDDWTRKRGEADQTSG